jgi:hypothetical protein
MRRVGAVAYPQDRRQRLSAATQRARHDWNAS